jgi:hypothetical protein
MKTFEKVKDGAGAFFKGYLFGKGNAIISRIESWIMMDLS